MIEWLWLLLPIAAATGWLSAWHQERQRSKNTFWSPDYLKGLNYLLNEEPDKAIDIFIKLIEVDSDTVETHLALGVLFRRRGEVNRAIRIHQNLIARPALHPHQRSNAMFELAEDYRCAGLLDRAEQLFQELVASSTHQVLALHQLLEIYQQEQDWEKAINTAQQLTNASSEARHVDIAQYYCEQAEYYRKQGQNNAALNTIQYALKIDSNCVRASLLEGQLALVRHDQEGAILAFQRIEQQNPDYLTEVIEPLQICYQTLGRQNEFVLYLLHILKHYGGIRPMLVLTEIVKQEEGEQQAVDFIVKEMHKRPSLQGLDHLLDMALFNVDNITRNHLLLLKDLMTQFLKNKPAYKCRHCGFTARKLHWQCPSCKQWSTLKPIQGIDSE
ncbi:lipopolysaccharide assembly protein LapB [Candidatus Parabeggiatoa sp. HSG14]|uniref:lipopolysaccharide assembly protein LapB n=1 Tax=Candidatus Parabeggiatoa sp. HSG14 TaxID=3055593 RepID=UPI0025A78616|nr:lipopolysaccharide assembly protein LapB [Thiotrichales bacterium HSG14]